MKNVYVVKDVLASSICLTVLADSDDIVKRILEGYVVSPHPNLVNSFVKDKQCYQVATIDEKTMRVTALDEPIFVVGVKDIQDAVLKELTKDEQFCKAQLGAIKAQKEVINGKPIKRKGHVQDPVRG